MILKQIYLAPDPVEFQEDSSDFQFETRHICNYIERQLAPEKVVVDGFNRLYVVGQSAPGEMVVNSNHVLSIPVSIDMNEWRLLPEERRPHYYSDLLKTGFARAASQYPIPVEKLSQWLADLKESGYRNEWMFLKKTFKKYDLRCRLDCRLTIKAFTLRLQIWKDDVQVFSDTILTTKPDELIFHHQFKDIVIENNEIVVTKRTTDSVLFRMRILSVH
jgi:hypothetical protein